MADEHEKSPDVIGEDYNPVNGEIQLHRIYPYRPYTYHRIKRIFLKYFNIELVYINQGYKANRRPGFRERYNLVEADTREVIAKAVTLDQCRRVFAYYYVFPEEDEYSAGSLIKRKENF